MLSHLYQKILFIKNKLAFSSLMKKRISGKRLIMLNTPSHGNLGDHAIAYAERDFLRNIIGESCYCEIQGDELRNHFQVVKNIIRRDMVLGICGGGYLGDLWMDEEELVRRIVISFPYNTIIVFPQTMYYHDSEDGMKIALATKDYYSKHSPNMFFFFRDSNSMDVFDKYINLDFPKYLVPDMVLSLKHRSETAREGVLICMREDKECVLSKKAKSIMEGMLKESFSELKKTSTVILRNISYSERDDILNDKWNEFSSAELVVTDRLHGMLFAAITGTPCIAFDNISNKVSGSYLWIKDLPYIVIGNEELVLSGEIHDVINKFLLIRDCVYTPQVDKWNELKNVVERVTVFR